MTPRRGLPRALPATEHLILAPERATFAALDATLELASRLLIAAHVDLFPDDKRSRDPGCEPRAADLHPVAECLIGDARRLRGTIAVHCAIER